MTGAALVILIVKIWFSIGVAVAAAFVTFGMNQIDEDAQGAVAFRPLIVPGIILIWPLVLWRWWVLATETDNWHLRHMPPRRSHAVVAAVMLVLLVLTFTLSMALRQTWPADTAPLQIEPATEVTE